MPLGKSAAARVRMAGLFASPATTGTRRRNHTAAGPGSAVLPATTAVSIAVAPKETWSRFNPAIDMGSPCLRPGMAG
jgi:hypothetical protein